MSEYVPRDEDAPPADDEALPADNGPTEPTPAAVESAEPAPGLEALPEVLDRLSAVEELTGELYAELTDYPSGGPWFWKELKPEQRAKLWNELDEFVTWLQNRILCHWSNPAGWIQPCWYKHPDAVELLTALMVAHHAAYRPKSKKPSFVLTEWFSRGLWPTMDALSNRKTFDNCHGAGAHVEASLGRVLTLRSPEFLDFVTLETAPSPADEKRK